MEPQPWVMGLELGGGQFAWVVPSLEAFSFQGYPPGISLELGGEKKLKATRPSHGLLVALSQSCHCFCALNLN